MKSFIGRNKQGQPDSQNDQLPPDKTIASICTILTKQFLKEKRNQKYAPIKEVLTLLGHGAVLSAGLLAPKSAPLLLSLIQESPDYDAWKQYNVSYLQRTLRRLEHQKHIEMNEEGETQILTLTDRGKRKILKYSIESLTIDKPRQWDHKWRLVIYDVPKKDKGLGDLIRQTLRSVGFYAIQESVYIYPYPCFDQIEFLRQYYRLGKYVQYMLIQQIENDEAYKAYFNLS